MKEYSSSKLFCTLFLLLIMVNMASASIETPLDQCQNRECIIDDIYECGATPTLKCHCNCDVLEDNGLNIMLLGVFGLFSLTCSTLVIVSFIKVKQLKEKPGDIILGIAASDGLIALGFITIGLFHFGLDLSVNPHGFGCSLTSVLYIIGSFSQKCYNLSFFYFLKNEIKTSLKGAGIPHYFYHAFPAGMAFLGLIYYSSSGYVGMGINGICTSRSVPGFLGIIFDLIAFTLFPIYVIYNLKNSIPANSKLAVQSKRLINHYIQYIEATALLYAGLTISDLFLRVGAMDFYKDAEDTILIKIASWAESIFSGLSPIILAGIRLRDPTVLPYIKKFLSLSSKTTDMIDVRDREEAEGEKIDEEGGPRNDTLKGIHDTMKVQLIYSILCSIHSFWESNMTEEEKIIDDDGLGVESMSTKTVKIDERVMKEKLPFLINEIQDKKYEAIDGHLKIYAPKIFEQLTSMDGTGRNVQQSLDLAANYERIVKAGINSSGGKSGEFFFFSSDNRLIIKTINNNELKILLEILPSYLLHFKNNKNSLISKIYGVFTYETADKAESCHLILMRNVARFPSRCIERRYDLKGSTFGRNVIKPDQDILLSEIKKYGTLKDLDFLRFEGRLHFAEDLREKFVHAIENDCQFLSSHGLIDYSLLVLLVNEKRGLRGSREFKTMPLELQNDGAGANEEANKDEESKENGGMEDEHLFESIPSRAEDLNYHVGIIDYLTRYGKLKKLEVFIKKMAAMNPKLEISVQNPQYYAKRFINFVRNVTII